MRSQFRNQALSERSDRARSYRDNESEFDKKSLKDLRTLDDDKPNITNESKSDKPLNVVRISEIHTFNNTERLHLR